jgi:hypothetical protein
MFGVKHRLPLGVAALGFAAAAIAQEGPVAPPRSRLSDSAPPTLSAFKDGFEAGRASWVREETEATARILAHDRSAKEAHEGEQSEHLAFEAGPGSALYYSYALPKIPVTGELRVSLSLRSTQQNPQLLARIMLPDEKDPKTGEPTPIMVAGTIYKTPGRWQRLELTDITRLIEEQARILRSATRKPVRTGGAYLDRLVLNVYGGPGSVDLYIDDLVIAPVPRELAAARQPEAAAPAPGNPASPPTPPRSNPGAARSGDRFRLEDGRLTRRDPGTGQWSDWVFNLVDAPGADLDALLRSGFDMLEVPFGSKPEVINDASSRGFAVMADLSSLLADPKLGADRVVEDAIAWPSAEQVGFWYLGEGLGDAIEEEARRRERDRYRGIIGGLSRAAKARGASAPSAAIVSGNLAEFAKGQNAVGLVGIPLDRQGWGSCQDPWESYQYLSQRRQLIALDDARALFWSWLPATAPDWARTALWGQDSPPAWGLPQVQPEQVRLYAYAALMAGQRGLGYRGNAELTRESGRGRLLEMSFLNAEAQLLSAIIARQERPPALLEVKIDDPIPTGPGGIPRSRKERPPHPTIKAVALPTRDNRGSLVLVADFAPGAQWQPPQMATNDLGITIPAPASAQAYEINPAVVRLLTKREQVPGGIRVVLPDFGVTSAILITTDTGLIDRISQAVARIRPRAVLMAIDQANWQFRQVSATYGQLSAIGKGAADAPQLFALAQEHLRSAGEALEREEHALAWDEARRASRPLRVLMRAQFEQAQKDLVRVTAPSDTAGSRTIIPPVASPGMLAYNTLPQHYVWLDFIARNRFGKNLLPGGGNFNQPDALGKGGWKDVGYRRKSVPSSVSSQILDNSRGDRCLRLACGPTDVKEIDALAPFLDHPAAAVRTPDIQVAAGQLIRVRVMVRMPRAVTPGLGGLIVRDSIGGEHLEFRTAGAIPDWREVVLYRRPDREGPFSVTLGLAGYGEAFFDDLVIERIEGAPAQPAEAGGLANRPRNNPPPR